MNWTKIKNEYVTTNIPLRELAKKHNVPLSTIRDHSTTEGWVSARKQFRYRLATESIDKAVEKQSEYRSAIYAIAVKLTKRIETLLDNPDYLLKPREITGALKDLKDILDIRSENDVREQQARIAKLEKEAEDTAEDTTVVVRFEGHKEGWVG